MSVRRSLALLLGLGLVTAGFAFVLDPSLARGLDVAEVVVTMLGAGGVGYAAYVLTGRYRSEQRSVDAPDHEAVATWDHPGEDVDELLERVGVGGRLATSDRRRLRRRLEATAVDAVRRHEGCSEAEARERLEAGTWTDDPAAASYFTKGGVALGDDLTRRDAARVRLSRGYRHGHAARRTVAAIAELSGVDGEGER